ncbi:procathepsin L-like [Haliotis rufescens]|uniref:procathepsin L-like n=1 Tax=Haliotis rufescens TaxID=6454 RepID=UPI00201E77F9|nr:procathepsin L-like [Haliotis rufescens]
MLRLGVLLSLLVSISCSRIDLDQDWERFKSQHQKAYISDVDAANRRALWEDNVGVIESHNLEADLGQHTYRLGQNRYTDMSHEEFLQLMTGYKQLGTRDDPSPLVLNVSSADLPDTVDWRKDGYVTDVKDQGACGSCWAFSAACSLEGQHYRKTGRLVSLSEQNLVDCARNGNYGCEGGYMELAFDYIRQNKGIDTEESYPYVAKQKDCNFSQENVGATDAGFAVVISESEDALKSAVALEGPISVGIDASSRSFMLYKSGIFSSSKCSSTKLNHAVTVVGYGAQKKQEYWLLKNSWSTTWGEDGYVFMARNDGNMCGIATEGILPLV